MFSKIIRSIALLGMVSVGGLVIAWMLFIVGRPDPTVNYLDELNAGIEQLSEEQKGWNIYRDVWAEYEFCEGGRRDFKELEITDGSGTRLVRPADAEWTIAIKQLEDSTRFLDSLRAGARAPNLGLALCVNLNDYSLEDRAALFPDLPAEGPLGGGLGVAGVAADVDHLLAESIINLLLPHIQSFRTASRILAVDSRYAVQQGDTDRVVKNLESIMGLAHQAAESKILVCKLVAVSVEQIGLELLDDLLVKNPNLFTLNQLTRVQKAIQSREQSDDLNLSGERLMMLDTIQRVYTNNGQGDGRITKQGLAFLDATGLIMGERFTGVRLVNQFLIGPVALFSIAPRRETTRQMESWLASMETQLKSPVYSKSTWDDLDQQMRQAAIRHPVLVSLFPDGDALHQILLKTRAQREGVLMALAVKRYRIREGVWPASANDLLDGFLESLPVDPLSGDSLKYHRRGETFVIYSVGLDGEDNQGFRPRIFPGGGRPDVEIGIEEWSRENDWVPEPTSRYQFDQPAQKGADFVIWPRKNEL